MLICLLYIHIKYYIIYAKTEQIYELDYISKLVLDKITYFKHPVKFNYVISNMYTLDKINIIDLSNNNELLLKKKSAKKLLNIPNYYSQYNDISNQVSDTLFKPITTVYSKYDILFGYKNTTTKLCSEYAYRTIFVVVDGSIDIILLHPKYILEEQLNCKHIVRESDYNIWKKNTLKHHIIHLEKGKALSVPMYWWWSIKFGQDAKVLQFKYYTLMNSIVILPILGQIWLNN